MSTTDGASMPTTEDVLFSRESNYSSLPLTTKSSSTAAPPESEEQSTDVPLNLHRIIAPVIIVAFLAAITIVLCVMYRLICKHKSIHSVCRVKLRRKDNLYEDPFNVDDATDDVMSDNKSWIGAGSSVTSGIDCTSQGSVFSQTPPPPPLIKRSQSQPGTRSNPSRFVVLLIDESTSPPRHVLRLKTRSSQLDSIEESIQSINKHHRRRHTIAKLRASKNRRASNNPSPRAHSSCSTERMTTPDSGQPTDMDRPLVRTQFDISPPSSTDESDSESALSEVELETV